MSIPKHSDDIHPERQAVAPYNFVPLPDELLTVETPPSQGIYHPNLMTGWIDIDIESCSPTYIRGMYTLQDYKEIGEKPPSKLTIEDKIKRAPFFTIENVPVIPGSSLRGMLRELVEIVSYGRMRWVSNSPTFTHRSMADKSDDPLKERYKEIFGNNASKVCAGYLVFEEGKWYVRPAKSQKLAEVGDNKDGYIKVYEEDISIESFITMDKDDYRPQLVEVSFQKNGRVCKRQELKDAAIEKNKNISDPKKHVQLDRPCYLIQSKDKKLKHQGWLVTSGNMRETGTEKLVRYKHCIFMPRDDDAEKIPIPDQVINDYRAGLTSYHIQTEPIEYLKDWRDGIHDESWGCLGNGKPVFYILSADKISVQYFGHNLNFRIPAMLESKRAVTPLDFVPEQLRYNPNPDMADAIFGWVEEWDQQIDAGGNVSKEQIGPAGACAGRVFFSDAFYINNKSGIWYKNSQDPITPKILSSPKPTTFQHYLVQDKSKDHDPDKKAKLAHFGTPPEETSIRGHKFYWHKGANPDIEYIPGNDSEKRPENILTRITPIKGGVQFSGKIHFENLRPEELGALCWVIQLPGEPGKTYRHKIGMGKPLGMGSVKITLNGLHISHRNKIDAPEKRLNDAPESRYEKLMDGDNWFQPKFPDKTSDECIQSFEAFMQEKNLLPEGQKLCANPRIAELLELLRWRGDTIANEQVIEVTRYMEINHATNRNEYSKRRVLPKPTKVFEGWFNEPIDLNAMAAEVISRTIIPPLSEDEDPAQLKPGQKIRAKVTSAQKEGDVYLTVPEYKRAEFVIRDQDRGPFDRFIKGKSIHLEILVVKEAQDEQVWIIYCKKA